jgi:hypothetical protein
LNLYLAPSQPQLRSHVVQRAAQPPALTTVSLPEPQQPRPCCFLKCLCSFLYFLTASHSPLYPRVSPGPRVPEIALHVPLSLSTAPHPFLFFFFLSSYIY